MVSLESQSETNHDVGGVEEKDVSTLSNNGGWKPQSTTHKNQARWDVYKLRQKVHGLSVPLSSMVESVLIDAFMNGLDPSKQAEVRSRHSVEGCMKEA